jgi:hypothetical protein
MFLNAVLPVVSVGGVLCVSSTASWKVGESVQLTFFSQSEGVRDVTTDISVAADYICGLHRSVEIFPVIIHSSDTVSYVCFRLLQNIPAFISNITDVAVIFLSRRIL